MHESLKLSISNLYARYDAWVQLTRKPSKRDRGLTRTTNNISVLTTELPMLCVEHTSGLCLGLMTFWQSWVKQNFSPPYI